MRPQNLKLGLRADSGLAVGQFYPLSAARNILGRSVDVAIPVDDAKVSRNHAAIDIQNGFYMLVDLGSTNGTYLNGHRVEQSEFVNPGDEVRVGSSVFVVELNEKAKTLASKNWREPTSVIFVPKAAADSVVEPVRRGASVHSSTGGGLTSMDTSFSMPRLTEQQRAYGRWVAASVSILLIVAAIALRIG